LETTLTSRGREVVVSIDRPFVIVGERINPTGRKVLAAEMKEGRMDRVRADAIAQVKAGAHMLDINAGIPQLDEAALLVAARYASIHRSSRHWRRALRPTKARRS
jgi:5-methyltetrahydrofolate--homocysteine methyltransferase